MATTLPSRVSSATTGRSTPRNNGYIEIANVTGKLAFALTTENEYILNEDTQLPTGDGYTLTLSQTYNTKDFTVWVNGGKTAATSAGETANGKAFTIPAGETVVIKDVTTAAVLGGGTAGTAIIDDPDADKPVVLGLASETDIANAMSLTFTMPAKDLTISEDNEETLYAIKVLDDDVQFVKLVATNDATADAKEVYYTDTANKTYYFDATEGSAQYVVVKTTEAHSVGANKIAKASSAIVEVDGVKTTVVDTATANRVLDLGSVLSTYGSAALMPVTKVNNVAQTSAIGVTIVKGDYQKNDVAISNSDVWVRTGTTLKVEAGTAAHAIALGYVGATAAAGTTGAARTSDTDLVAAGSYEVGADDVKILRAAAVTAPTGTTVYIDNDGNITTTDSATYIESFTGTKFVATGSNIFAKIADGSGYTHVVAKNELTTITGTQAYVAKGGEHTNNEAYDDTDSNAAKTVGAVDVLELVGVVQLSATGATKGSIGVAGIANQISANLSNHATMLYLTPNTTIQVISADTNAVTNPDSETNLATLSAQIGTSGTSPMYNLTVTTKDVALTQGT